MKPDRLHSKWPMFAGWAGLLIAWVSLFSRTSLWWNEASYYTHGWCVSFLALVLLARRRVDWPLKENLSGASWLMPLAILLLLPARLCSRNHDPETCMQYTGVKLLDSDKLFRYEFQGNELLFRHYATPPDEPQ